jgi:uncharacterized membrane protein
LTLCKLLFSNCGFSSSWYNLCILSMRSMILYIASIFVYEFPACSVVQRLMLDRQISKISFFAEYSFITFLNLSAVISSYVVEQRSSSVLWSPASCSRAPCCILQIVEVVMDSHLCLNYIFSWTQNLLLFLSETPPPTEEQLTGNDFTRRLLRVFGGVPFNRADLNTFSSV